MSSVFFLMDIMSKPRIPQERRSEIHRSGSPNSRLSYPVSVQWHCRARHPEIVGLSCAVYSSPSSSAQVRNVWRYEYLYSVHIS